MESAMPFTSFQILKIKSSTNYKPGQVSSCILKEWVFQVSYLGRRWSQKGKVTRETKLGQSGVLALKAPREFSVTEATKFC